uniref:Uncharacterized protein n=1 Tax=Parascaris equorum TaxID=6256 RepID=A0A914S0H0_PAREQ
MYNVRSAKKKKWKTILQIIGGEALFERIHGLCNLMPNQGPLFHHRHTIFQLKKFTLCAANHLATQSEKLKISLSYYFQKIKRRKYESKRAEYLLHHIEQSYCQMMQRR